MYSIANLSFKLQHNIMGVKEELGMVVLSIGVSRCQVQFSSSADRDTFARRIRRAHLRADWGDHMCCVLRASAAGSVLRLLAQDGGIVVQIVESVDDAAAHGSSDNTGRPKHGSQLTLW